MQTNLSSKLLPAAQWWDGDPDRTASVERVGTVFFEADALRKLNPDAEFLDACWLYHAKNAQVRYHGRTIPVYKVLYAVTHGGSIPSGVGLFPTCTTGRLCVNPLHRFAYQDHSATGWEWLSEDAENLRYPGVQKLSLIRTGSGFSFSEIELKLLKYDNVDERALVFLQHTPSIVVCAENKPGLIKSFEIRREHWFFVTDREPGYRGSIYKCTVEQLRKSRFQLRGKAKQLHRVVYELVMQREPAALYANCDSRICVSPFHRIATQGSITPRGALE